ncbi:fasciclin domain-containing protein [Sphingobacterium tabacisoli]|uniref:Fasciclin domain-containing protein n=1 Tax=Sphingobacterium tabacisoli TaxID=2044855 RepID=A0ABW5L2W3_9SPHI|nr:fasciclin domain-containing protein [Sphingobacterium tabacisoli]
MNTKNYISIALGLFSILFFSLSCQKNEFMPDPMGEKVPFEDTLKSDINQLLKASPELKTFYTAWEKSTVEEKLRHRGTKTKATIFAPNDAALQKLGVTVSAIAAMTVADVDSLVLFYVSVGDIKVSELKERSDNFIAKSMLSKPGLFVRYFEGNPEGTLAYDPYFYRHYVRIQKEQVMINGKKAGKLNYKRAVDGGLYMLETAIEKPTKTMLEVLEADGRFKMFVESQRLADEMFVERMIDEIEPWMGFRPSVEDIQNSWANYRFYYQRGWIIESPAYEGYKGPNIGISTLFAPTDDAFRKAGFNTVQDILTFNIQRGDARFDPDMFEIAGGYPMDTVYSYHRNWGRIVQPATLGKDKAMGNATVFFSNDLTPSLNEYMVNVGGNVTMEYAYKMPLSFSANNGQIQIKVKNSEHAPVNVIEADILTLNGPIHVVDNLILPKGFKLK